MSATRRPIPAAALRDCTWDSDRCTCTEKAEFAKVENERPEMLQGWSNLFEQTGMIEVDTVDKSAALPMWFKDYNRRMGLMRQLALLVRILRHWGVSGYRNIRASQRIIESEYAGYGIIVGRKAGR